MPKEQTQESPDQLLSLRDKLRLPLPDGAVKHPPPVEPGKKASKRNLLSSINPAYVVERLNDVFGENGWFADYVIIEGSLQSPMVVVRCDFRAPKWGIERHCFGGNDNSDRGDAYKGACSDALGKVASQIGIAGDVYKGIYDKELTASGTNGTGKRKEKRAEYELVDGIVTEYRRMGPDVLWLQIHGNPIRVGEKVLIERLGNCQGKRLQIRCRWDTVGKQKRPVLSLMNVMGVFEPVPSEPNYAELTSMCATHGLYQGEGNCPKCEQERQQ